MMRLKKQKKAFTLVELLVTVAIIGILITIVAISYTGAQKRSRDSKRKADLNAIASAYQMHYQETKTWKFSNNELQKIVPDPSVVYSGEGAGGNGWFNYSSVPSYRISMSKALVGLGYLSNELMDPLIKSATIPRIGGKAAQYMKYFCNTATGQKGIFIFARLEDDNAVANPFSIDKNAVLDECRFVAPYNTLSDYVQRYEMNYGVGIR